MIYTNIRRNEAKSDPKKSLYEWLKSGATTRKLRELLPQGFNIERSRSAQFMMTADCVAWFQDDSKRNVMTIVNGTIHVYSTNSGMCFIKGRLDGIYIGSVDQGSMDEALSSSSKGTSDQLHIEGDVVYPTLRGNRWYSNAITIVHNLDEQAMLSVSECASYIDTQVGAMVDEMSAEVHKFMSEYKDFTFTYQPVMSTKVTSPFKSLPDCSEALSDIQKIQVAVEAAKSEADRMYNGKDIFGGEYKIDISGVTKPVGVLRIILQGLDGKVHDVSKERPLFERYVESTDKLCEALAGLWNGIVKLDKQLNNFVGNPSKKEVNLTLSAGDVEYLINDFDDDQLMDAVKGMNLMQECGRLCSGVIEQLFVESYFLTAEEVVELLETSQDEFGDGAVKVPYYVHYPKFVEIHVKD